MNPFLRITFTHILIRTKKLWTDVHTKQASQAHPRQQAWGRGGDLHFSSRIFPPRWFLGFVFYMRMYCFNVHF